MNTMRHHDVHATHRRATRGAAGFVVGTARQLSMLINTGVFIRTRDVSR